VPFAVSLSQLLLALVFAVAAVAKLADLHSAGDAMEAFSLPARLAPGASLVLPIAELAIAFALLAATTARWAALAAVALLLVFSLAIGRVLRAGSAVDCNCFGALGRTAVGRGTLIRNLLLVALALAVVLGGQSVSAFSWTTVPAAQDRIGVTLLVACVIGLGWFCWQLLQQNGRLLVRLEEADAAEDERGTPLAELPPLERGAPAPTFSGHDLDGAPVSLSSLLGLGRPVALFFTNPGCGACEAALEMVARVQRERADELTLAVISGGGIGPIRDKAAEFGLDRVIPQSDEALFDAYRVQGVPGVVAIDSAGAISSPAALGIHAVRRVILGEEEHRAGQTVELLGS
jgi:thiol-disulfide isomerase/thioredoxin